MRINNNGGAANERYCIYNNLNPAMIPPSPQKKKLNFLSKFQRAVQRGAQSSASMANIFAVSIFNLAQPYYKRIIIGYRQMKILSINNALCRGLEHAIQSPDSAYAQGLVCHTRMLWQLTDVSSSSFDRDLPSRYPLCSSIEPRCFNNPPPDKSFDAAIRPPLNIKTKKFYVAFIRSTGDHKHRKFGNESITFLL